MYKLVLIRHGESTWNLENRFTGWTDVDLTEQGMAEAKAGGQLLKEGGYQFDIAYTSVLKRAIKTLKDFFELNLATELNLTRITAPLFVKSGTGINDDLNGVEKPVSFAVPAVAPSVTSAEITCKPKAAITSLP